MLDLPQPLFIRSLLRFLMANVGGRNGGGLVRRRKRVEHPDVEEGAFEPPSPHSIIAIKTALWQLSKKGYCVQVLGPA